MGDDELSTLRAQPHLAPVDVDHTPANDAGPAAGLGFEFAERLATEPEPKRVMASFLDTRMSRMGQMSGPKPSAPAAPAPVTGDASAGHGNALPVAYRGTDEADPGHRAADLVHRQA